MNVYAYLHDPLTHVDIDGLARTGSGGNATKPKTAKSPSEALAPGCSLLGIQGAAGMDKDKLKAELEKRAKAMEEKLKKGDVHVPGPPPPGYTLTKDDLSPCLSAGVDKHGNVFYGQNTGSLPENMDQRLADAARKQAEQPRHGGGIQAGSNTPAGTHSEVHATDRALKTDPATQPKDVTVYNLNTNEKSKTYGQEKPCCPNCTGTLNADKRRGDDGVNTTTTPQPRDTWWVNKESGE
jgi:hypothetical protein